MTGGSSSSSGTAVNPSMTEVTGVTSPLHRSIKSGSTPAMALASAAQKSSQIGREAVVEIRSECGNGVMDILFSVKLILIIVNVY